MIDLVEARDDGEAKMLHFCNVYKLQHFFLCLFWIIGIFFHL